jgi:CubicO group peptidase (beta-lactamase class C family)
MCAHCVLAGAHIASTVVAGVDGDKVVSWDDPIIKRYLLTDNYFRSKYDYINFGLTEAAVATAKATGKTWEDFSSQRLYQRLGMQHTSSRFADYEVASNRARLHVEENGQWVAKYTREPDAQTPAGSVSYK